MHEFSVMQQVVAAVLEQVREHPGLSHVEEVQMDVGELTFLGEEQLEFSFQVLCETNNLLKSAKLVISKKPSLALCPACGYKGPLKYLDTEGGHSSIPLFSCPDCGDVVDIVDGKQCMITNIRAVVNDVEGGHEEK